MANEEILELQIRDNAADAASGLSSLAAALTRVKEAVGKGMNMKGTVNGLERLKQAVNAGLDENSIQRFERLAGVLERLKSIGALKISGIKNISNQLGFADAIKDETSTAAEAVAEAGKAIDAGMEEVAQRTGNKAGGLKTALGNAWAAIKDVVGGLQEVDKESGKSANTSLFDGLRQGAKNLSNSLKNLIGDFGRIVKYRIIRSIIKQITQAFTEGVKNVYNYSKAIGSSFAPAMNDAASVLLQFKNSIGAAVAPLIEAFIPYLKIAVEWLINMINYLNQFISLVQGKTTWTKALYKATDAFEDTKKKAKGASGALKELLADWDELNIIQSETGSGSGSTQAVEDYTKMFETVNEFDLGLKKGFEGILDTVKEIAATLLLWKFSSMFTGIISKLMKLGASVLLITLGLQIGYNSAFDIGTNGLNAKNILGTILGALAAGLGGKFVANIFGLGGAIGWIVGISCAVVIDLIAYLKGTQNAADKIKWGDNTLTAEELEEYVRKRFSFDVSGEIQIMDSAITNASEARGKLNQKILKFSSSLVKVRMHVDKTEDSIKALAAEAREVVAAVQETITQETLSLQTALQLIPIKTETGADLGPDILKNVKLADKELENWLTQQGESIADLIDQGIKNKWQGNEAEMALNLMDHLNNIIDEAEQNRAQNELKVGLKGNIAMLDRDNAEAVLEREIELMNEYEAKAKELYEGRIVGLQFKADLADAIGKTDLAKQYRAAAEQLQNEYKDAIIGKMTKVKEELRDEWANAMVEVYGEETTKVIDEETAKTMKWWTGADVLTPFAENLKNKFANGGSSEASRYIADYLRSTFEQAYMVYDAAGNEQYYLGKIMDQFGMTAWDMLDNNAKKQLIQNVQDIVGTYQDAVDIIMNAFHLDYSDLSQLDAEFQQADVGGMLKEDLQESLDDEKVGLNVAVNPIIDKTSIDDLYDELRKTILNEKYIGQEKKHSMLDQLYGLLSDDNIDAMEQLKYAIDSWGVLNGFQLFNEDFMKDNAWGRLGARQLASAGGMSDVSYTPRSVTAANGQAETDEQMYNNIEKGMKSANEAQNEILRTVETLVRQIASKDFTVKVYPNSQWGMFNNKVGGLASKVTGG